LLNDRRVSGRHMVVERFFNMLISFLQRDIFLRTICATLLFTLVKRKSPLQVICDVGMPYYIPSLPWSSRLQICDTTFRNFCILICIKSSRQRDVYFHDFREAHSLNSGTWESRSVNLSDVLSLISYALVYSASNYYYTYLRNYLLSC